MSVERLGRVNHRKRKKVSLRCGGFRSNSVQNTDRPAVQRLDTQAKDRVVPVMIARFDCEEAEDDDKYFFLGFLLGTYRVMSNLSTSPPPMHYGSSATNCLHLATTYVFRVFRDKLFWKEEKKKRTERQGKKRSRSKPMMSRKAKPEKLKEERKTRADETECGGKSTREGARSD